MPKNHDKQIIATKMWINAEGQEDDVCMWDFHHGNSGLGVSYFLFGWL